MTTNDAYSDDTKPSNLGTMRSRRDTILGKPEINRLGDTDDNMYAAKGGRAGYKSGGKTKPKSIGKALRGGGKVMR